MEFIIDESVPVEIITNESRDEWFMEKIKEFLHKQNKYYRVFLNTNQDWWDSKNCKIVICFDFSCNVEVPCKVFKNNVTYEPCRKCHIKYHCQVSREFSALIEAHGYSYYFLDCVSAGIFRND